ncbi:MAG: Fic family protein [Kiritimatiellales bacterium]|nr:Fic family protein [Kiritimatiellales bacterium]
MLNLEKSPYLVDAAVEREILAQVKTLEERIKLLRAAGTLTPQTIKDYYGEKRFEQIAESNALEGSTLTAGETELAVLKGITITGHDPAFTRDARALDEALKRLIEMAHEYDRPTDISQLHELHRLILGGVTGAGVFRHEPVRIKGSPHSPPKTWKQIMDNMEAWEKWSIDNAALPAPIRSVVLHAWLAHIHPFIDGNGRTARAISNLELIRAGYPPIIIKKRERDRYIESLSDSDLGGDIRSFMELILDRIDGSIIGLEQSARKHQNYSIIQERIRQSQKRMLNIWTTSVELLAKTIEHYLQTEIEAVGGKVYVKIFESPLDLDDFVSVCDRRSAQKSWAFILNIEIPSLPKSTRLAYIGYRTPWMFHELGNEGGPSIYWSVKNPTGYPMWNSLNDSSPFAVEITTKLGAGDEWYARRASGLIENFSTTVLAKEIASSLLNAVSE